jgi:tetratricopeptide (TPR) repeat protein
MFRGTPMSALQHRVSEYLQCELFHVMGAYRIAEDRLHELEQALSNPSEGQEARAPARLIDLTRMVREYNGAMAMQRDRTRGRQRHPLPSDLPLSVAQRFTDSPASRGHESPWREPDAWSWVAKFYESAVKVLRTDRKWSTLNRLEQEFTECLTCPREGLAGSGGSVPRVRRARRHDRFKQRLALAYKDLPGVPATDRGELRGDPGRDDPYLLRITTANLGTAARELPLFVLDAQAEAHLSMHGVEALMSLPFGDDAKSVARRGNWLQAELRRCIALDTFAYSVSRSAPWIFAEDEAESQWVFENLSDAWHNVVPTRCMWIGAQVSLLALHRRAYARSLQREARPSRVGAYNDYHKLQRLIRDTERRIKSAPIHVEGALEFLEALDAQAHHHIGELYRAEQAQTSALRHFDAGEDRLKTPRRRGTMDEVLVDSRWLVQLHVSRGKSSYELGRHKDALRSYLIAWRAFLQLLAATTKTETSTEDIDSAIDWLDEVRHEPELRKPEVYRHLRPIVEQLAGINVNRRLGALAGEILLRLGHLLFVLNVGSDLKAGEIRAIVKARRDQRDTNPEALWPYQRHDEAISYVVGRLRNGLSALVLRKAAECDPHSTLIGADLAKIGFRADERGGTKLPAKVRDAIRPPQLARVGDQWPLGGDDYEHISRVVEYLLLRAMVDRKRGAGPGPKGYRGQDELIASRLLLAFFTHNDSIGARKSQTHRYLMQPRHPGPDVRYTTPTIEFICVRRYSSAFPLLPRPSAFHAHGGGYFVRLHSATDEPFGIVIDPGTDFVENLYRTGYGLSDIDMIVVTHDHVDHVGALDALLSLLHERNSILGDEGQGSLPPVTVIANRSVRRRYHYADQIQGKRFRRLEALQGAKGLTGVLPTGFRLRSISSAEGGPKTGHRDLGGSASLGLVISTESGASLAFTSDVPSPPRAGTTRRKRWQRRWQEALEADVLVAHLSTVPLTEMRKLSRLSAVDEAPRPSEINVLCREAESLRKAANGLTGEVQTTQAVALALADLIRRLGPLCSKKLASASNHEVAERGQRLTKAAERLLKDLGDARGLTAGVVRAIDEVARKARTLGGDTKLPTDSVELLEACRSLEATNAGLRGRLEFAFWLRSQDGKAPPVDLLDRVGDWSAPRWHPYLEGFLAWARAYRTTRGKPSGGLFVVGELSEELGTARSKIAATINDSLFKSRRLNGTPRKDAREKIHALTADVGLRLLVTDAPRGRDRTRVLCSTCSLDNDRVRDERFHHPLDIREVCVKGENEGVFYNCDQHDPSQQLYPAFLEQLERFDIFGR